MGIEINLLEEKEKRNVLPPLILTLFVVLFLITFAFFTIQKSKLAGEAKALENQVEKVKTQQERYNLSAGSDRTSRDQLKMSLDQLKGTIVPVVPVIRDFVSLLPARGFFESFVLSGRDEVTILVRFDTMQEAAEYTRALQQQPFIEQVNLEAVEAEVIDETEDLYDYQPRYLASYYLKLDDSVLLTEGGEQH
ncbi:PilN domain-containing protein [Halobacillus litoralis]|uniref:PilN domain-containing protein n=1 Tax=Halobacillus litoralis TaxID=45668 RepID=UPI001CFE1C01|nr:hypothetical protein [Halobacillus litoralis]